MMRLKWCTCSSSVCLIPFALLSTKLKYQLAATTRWESDVVDVDEMRARPFDPIFFYSYHAIQKQQHFTFQLASSYFCFFLIFSFWMWNRRFRWVCVMLNGSAAAAVHQQHSFIFAPLIILPPAHLPTTFQPTFALEIAWMDAVEGRRNNGRRKEERCQNYFYHYQSGMAIYFWVEEMPHPPLVGQAPSSSTHKE